MDELGIEPPPPPDEESNWVDTLLYWMLGGLVIAVMFSRSGCEPGKRLNEVMAAFQKPGGEARPKALDDPGGKSSGYVAAYNQAVALANAQRWAEALPHAEAASRADASGLDNESRAAAPLLRGQILSQLRRHDEALWAIEQARSYTSSAKLHEALASVHFAKQDYRQALAHGRDFIDSGGTVTPHTYFLIGFSYDRLGDTEQAAQWISRGHNEFPDDKNLTTLAAKYGRQARSERGMSTHQDGRFVLKFVNLPEQAEVRDQALRALSSAYSRACDSFGFQPREALPVILYPTTGSYYNASGAPQWSAAQYDGKIRVPLNSGTSQGLDAVVAHEMTHYVVHEIAGNNVPAWLDEGLAQIAEGRDDRWAESILSTTSGRFTLEQLEAPFTRIGDATQARVAYAQALLTTRRLVSQVGMGRMRGILDQLAAGRKIGELVDLR